MKKFMIASACVIGLGGAAVGVNQFSASADDEVVGGVSQNQSESQEQNNANSGLLSVEEISEIANQDYPGKVVDIDLESDDGVKKYDLDIIGEDYKYEVEYHAETGEFIKEDEKESLNSSNQKAESNLLSAEEISERANQDYPGTVTDVDLDSDDGVYKYDIDITDSEFEYELEYNAETGEFIKEDEKERVNGSENNGKTDDNAASNRDDDDNDEDDDRESASSTNGLAVSMDDAKTIAVKEVGNGASVKEIELDDDDGRMHYEMELYDNNNNEVDVDIDAETGDVMKVDYDD